jgi:hypothetical protein
VAKDKGPPALKFPAHRVREWAKAPPTPKPPPVKRGPRGPAKPKCRCGCGKAAQWPEGNVPKFFYTRKCGYLMAIKMLSPKLQGDAR